MIITYNGKNKGKRKPVNIQGLGIVGFFLLVSDVVWRKKKEHKKE